MKKLLLFLPLFFMACSQDNGTEPVVKAPPTLEIRQVPQLVNPGKDYTISVKVVSEGAIAAVTLDVFASELWFSTELYDDGATLHNDGDVIAHDMIFTQKLHIPEEVISASQLSFEFIATDTDAQESELVSATVGYSGNNSAPVLQQVEGPHLLASGFDGQAVFSVTVTDENGLDDIAAVKCEAFIGDLLSFNFQLQPQSAGVYTMAFDSTFAVGLYGDFVYHFYAVDKSGEKSNEILHAVIIENKAPVVLEAVHSDSVKRPAANMRVGLLVQVAVQDDQSLADIVHVKMDWKKPDGTLSQNSPFELYDNGLPLDEENLAGWDQGYRGDLEANDGIYSITAMFDDDDLLGEYELTFSATDFAGNQSEKIKTTITLY